MVKPVLRLVLVGLLAGLPLAGQDARVRRVGEVAMPRAPDSNSPAFWRDGRLFWFGSHGGPWLSVGPNQFGPWETRNVPLESPDACPHWMEAVWPDDDGVLWGWYHAEPIGLVPDSTLTAPKIGAVVSFDGGSTLRDIGVVLESGDPLDPTARNGYFVGGHGDFSVLLDRQRRYFYFLFDNYGGVAGTQGVCVARMAFEDRSNPAGKVWKYHDGAWQEAGRGGRVTPIFPVRRSWQAREPDAFWGPSVHWNTYLNCYVMLLNRAAGGGWSQEGVYVAFSPDLSRPELWSQPRKILDRAEFIDPGAFYPQVMGLEPGGTDRRAGQTARLYLRGVSRWEIDFVAPDTAPTQVEVSVAPDSAAIAVGTGVTLSVTAMGQPPFAYQWLKDGAAIPAATAATYELAAVSANDAGVYAVIVSNALGAATSRGVTLAVTVPVVVPPLESLPAPRPEAFLSNLSVRAWLASEHARITVGFAVRTAGPKPLVLRAIGPTLARFGLTDAAADPRLEVFDATGRGMAANDDWMEADAEAFATAGAFALPAGSADAGLVVAVPAGTGTARARANGAGEVLVELYDPAAARGAKILNLSARARVGAGTQAMVAGWSVTGAGDKRILLRVLGPGLAAFGVGEALADPVLEVFGPGQAKMAENDDWDAALEAAFAEAGAPALPPGSRDAAVVLSLAAGNSYTATVRSADGATGEVLLEIYELP